MENRTLLSTFLVNNTGDSGSGTLRQAILDSNATTGTANTIDFDIPGSGVHTVYPLSLLPTITNPVLIDGFSQPGPHGTPLIQIIGSLAGAVDGLVITAPNVTVRGLDIAYFLQGAAIHITGTGATGDWIAGNFVGTDPSGTKAESNNYGVQIDGGASGNLVGSNGDGVNDPAERNVISGDVDGGIWINGQGTSGNAVAGNFIGTNVTGDAALNTGSAGRYYYGSASDSAAGVVIDGGASGNRIGTDDGSVDDAGERNVVAGGVSDGIDISGAGTENNIVAGNFIGTDRTGKVSLGIGEYGVWISDRASANWIGVNPDGDTALGDEGNVISGAGYAGVAIESADGNVVSGNKIGTDLTGTVALGNGADGVDLGGSSNNTIGGTSAGAGNVISANNRCGIYALFSDTTSNVIQGNKIGTDVTGTLALGNGFWGVILEEAGDNTVGGASTGAGNLISGNGQGGVEILGSYASGDVVLGNLIGTDATGTRALGNGGSGVELGIGDIAPYLLPDAASDASIGGTVSGAGNVISANAGSGVLITGAGTTGVVVQGNLIGTDATGTLMLGNADAGVQITAGAAGNMIGGADAGAGNVISGNAVAGVVIADPGTDQNQVAGNIVGADRTGTAPIPNDGPGIDVKSNENTIGGGTAAAGNLITGNLGPGIAVGTSASDIVGADQITANRIFANRGQAIDLANDGLTLNATSPRRGPNNLQNSPLIFAIANGQIAGRLVGSSPFATFRVDFYASSALSSDGSGEAEDFLGAIAVTTDSTGQAAFAVNFTIPDRLPIVTATATDSQGNTSEVSTPALRQAALTQLTDTARVVSGQPAVFSVAAGDAIALKDPYAGPYDPVWGLSLSVPAGSLSLSRTTGLTGSGNGTDSLSYSGPLSALNAALAGMNYSPPAGFHGNTTLSLHAVSVGAAPVNLQVLVTDGLFMVTTTADSGPGSLRQAILDSNAVIGGTNTVEFNIAGAGLQTISLLTPLPPMTTSLLIDGTSQPGYAGSPLIALETGSSGPSNDLMITGVNLSVRGLAGPDVAFASANNADGLSVQSGPRRSGQIDSYRIVTSTDALLVARVHGVGVGTSLALTDAQGALLVLSDGTSSTNPDDEIDEHLPAGTYYLVVSSTAAAGDYTLTATWTPASSPLQPGSDLAGIEGPQGMVVGDFNADGIPDIATPSGVELGVGDGTFRSLTNALPVPKRADDLTAIAEGDFFRDGHLDLVIVDQTTDSLLLFRGNGDGTFQAPESTPAGEFPGGDSPTAVVAGDFNGDGNLDLAVAFTGNQWEGGADPGGVSILLGNGDGTFQTPRNDAAGMIAAPADLVAGTFGGNGRLDLAVTNFNAGTITLLIGNGDGSFGAPVSYATGANPSSIALGDVNGDSKLDLVVNSGLSDVAVLRGNGDGTFQAAALYTTGYGPGSVVAGDFNGDGKLDLAVADTYGTNDIDILRGNGDGTFQPPREFYAVRDSNHPTLLAADFVGNGRLDLAESIPGNNGVTVLLQNPDGSFGAPGQNQNEVGPDPNLVVAADFNGDGKPDLIAVDLGSSSLLMGNGDGTFQVEGPLPFGDGNLYAGGIAMVTGDFNGDGRADVVIASGPEIDVELGNGDGTFQFGGTELLPFAPDTLLAGDFNGDGRLDLIAAADDPAGLAVLEGDGDGTFQPPKRIAAPVQYIHSMIAGDFNGDGKLDLAVAGAGDSGGEIAVLSGNGDGTFQPATTTLVPFTPTLVVDGDFNGDGKLDLAAAGVVHTTAGFEFELGVWTGRGDGTFPSPEIEPLGLDPVFLVAGDVTGGRRSDLVVLGTNLLTDEVEIATFANRGDGTFSTATPTDLGPQLFQGSGLDPVNLGGALVADDFNSDGREDLAFLNYNSNNVTILQSNPDGTFSPPRLDVTTSHATPLVADVNVDGTQDVLVVDGAGDILYRQGVPGQPGSFQPPVTVDTGFPSRDIAWIPNTLDGPLLASVDARDNAVSLYAYQNGRFVRVGSLATGQLPSQVIAADLNGSGWVDLVVRNAGDGTLSVFRNNELGSFWTNFDNPFLPAITLPIGVGISDVRAFDISSNRRLDLVVTNALTGQASVLFNEGSGVFTSPFAYRAGTGLSQIDPNGSPEVSSQEATTGVAAGVLGPGGPFSLVTINPGSDTFDVLAGLGEGRFANPIAISTQFPARVVRMGDFTHNGLDDLAVLTPGGVSIYLADGKGGFGAPTTYAVGPESNGMTLTDLGGTGILDLLVGDAYGDVLVLKGNGDGTFQAYRKANQAVELAVTDLTGNGARDIIYADQSLDRVAVDYGSGGLTVLADQSSGLLDPGAVKLADLNGDGIPDLIVANSGSNNVLIYPGLGNGQFGPAVNGGHGYFVGTSPVGITVANLTGPLPDLIVADEGSNQVSILLNQSHRGGAISFSAGPRLNSGGSGPVSTLVGNFRRGAFPDILVTNSQSNDVVLLPGVGQGFFDDQNPRVFSVGINPVTSFVGNFNGQPDLVTVNAGSNSLTVISGFESANPIVSTIPSGGVDPTTAFDFSAGNGFDDLVVGNSGDGALALFEGGPDGLELVSLDEEPNLPDPTALAFSTLTGGQVEFYAATAGRESAELVALSLSFQTDTLTSLAAAAAVSSATSSLQLVALHETSLPLVATVLTLTLEVSTEEVLAGRGEAESLGVAAALAGPGTSAGQGPFSTASGRGLTMGASDGSDESGVVPMQAPAVLAPWERLVLGLDEALEEMERQGAGAPIAPSQRVDRPHGAPEPGIPAPSAPSGLRSVPAPNPGTDRADPDVAIPVTRTEAVDAAIERLGAEALGYESMDIDRPTPVPGRDEPGLVRVCLAVSLLASRWQGPRGLARRPGLDNRQSGLPVRRRPQVLI